MNMIPNNVNSTNEVEKENMRNSIYVFFLCYILIFIFFSFGISLIPFILDVLGYFMFNKDFSVFLPIKYYIGSSVISFFMTIYYLYNN